MVRSYSGSRPSKKLRSAGQTKPESHSPAIDEDAGTTVLDSAPNTTKRSLELVEWRDANFSLDGSDEWDGDYINATVGWTEEDAEWLKITSEVTPGGERAVTRVPLVNVLSRKHLVIVNSPSTWTTSHERME